MKNLVVLALGLAMVAAPALSALAADVPGAGPGQKPIHQSVSMITCIDRAAGLMVIRLDGGRLLRLIVDGATAGDPLAALEPGDFIREHCTRGDVDTARALLIRRVRTASQELESFEQ